ncbi:hypothetical protein AMELA_G00084530 [Ameiurus melas]|uniref:Uncharacterized protein n=1 Tax=Ameiurus melas TaxID=219545 RepID=A0A7J6AWI4_AMEME|nr:hypothetical protein AMELA_G00084530 [Ameiurus melas]
MNQWDLEQVHSSSSETNFILQCVTLKNDEDAACESGSCPSADQWFCSSMPQVFHGIMFYSNLQQWSRHLHRRKGVKRFCCIC